MQTAIDSNNKKKNQQGFTLIEIIAVLVILGILAAVAIPKYQDLQTQARIKGAQGIIAGAMSSASLAYSQALLQNGAATMAEVATACGQTEVTGEYNLSCTPGTDSVSIVVSSKTAGLMVDQNATWTSPEK